MTTTPSELRFVVPLPANLGNARLHWRAKQRAKKAYWFTLNTLLRLGRLPPPPHRPLDPAVMEVHWFVWNIMDRSNTMARLKWVEDWLTAHGYIADDSPEHLTYVWPPKQTIERKEPRLEFTLTTRDPNVGEWP